MNSLLWIVQSFTNEDFDLDYLTNKLIKLQYDLIWLKRQNLKLLQTTLIFGYCFSTILNTKLSLKKQFPFLFACLRHTIASKAFFLVEIEIKSKKKNSIKDVDALIRGALETWLMPRFSQLADKIQRQQSH